jgi:hypothetical protein
MRDINEYTGSILRTAREEGEALRSEAARRREAFLAEQRGQLELEDARKREEFGLWLDREYALRLAHRRRAAQKELSGYRLEPGDYEVVFGSQTAERISPSALIGAVAPPPGVSLSLSLDTLPGQGGFVLRSGVVEYVFLFGDLLRDLREQRGSETIRRLFEQEGP